MGNATEELKTHVEHEVDNATEELKTHVDHTVGNATEELKTHVEHEVGNATEELKTHVEHEVDNATTELKTHVDHTVGNATTELKTHVSLNHNMSQTHVSNEANELFQRLENEIDDFETETMDEFESNNERVTAMFVLNAVGFVAIGVIGGCLTGRMSKTRVPSTPQKFVSVGASMRLRAVHVRKGE